VLALVGGARDYENQPVSIAPSRPRRQAGSLFKLFVYLTALQRGVTRRSPVVVDRPTQIGEWEPQKLLRRLSRQA